MKDSDVEVRDLVEEYKKATRMVEILKELKRRWDTGRVTEPGTTGELVMEYKQLKSTTH